MADLIMFCILAAVIVGSAILCVTTKRIMRAATFLLFVLFGVAGLYFLLDYTYLGAAQISVYAGGITMMYIFAIQLVSKRTLQGLVERMSGSRVIFGGLMTVVGLAVVLLVMLKNSCLNGLVGKACETDFCAADGCAVEKAFGLLTPEVQPAIGLSPDSLEVPMKAVGEALLGSEKYGYVLPFEFISVFLLACIIGGIVIARKEEEK